MNSQKTKAWITPILILTLCLSLATGCGSKKLAAGFNEDEVKKEAENIISLLNNKDAEGLKAIASEEMKAALTDEVFSKIFEDLGQGGKIEEIQKMNISGHTDKSRNEDFAVVIAKVKYEEKTFTYTISFNKQMELAGLYYK